MPDFVLLFDKADKGRQKGQLKLGQILASRKVAGVGACTGIDHRVLANSF
jgi:hypothetical protein